MGERERACRWRCGTTRSRASPHDASDDIWALAPAWLPLLRAHPQLWNAFEALDGLQRAAAAIAVAGADRVVDGLLDRGERLLMALKGAPAAAAIKALRDGYAGPETIHVAGRDAYLIYPEGIGRSKPTNTQIERKLGVAGTGRNWNTVLKLAALAAE